MATEEVLSPEVIVVVHHDLKAGAYSNALERLIGNGQRMSIRPGFVTRQIVSNTANEQNELSTVTTWLSRADYESWVAHNRATNPHKGKSTPFIGPPRATVYEVEHGQRPSEQGDG